jgi:Ca2+:H+ antiporter
MNWLLVFVPVAIGLERLAPDRHLLVFVTSSLALLPLAMWLGRATQQLAERMGEGVGGLVATIRTTSCFAGNRIIA